MPNGSNGSDLSRAQPLRPPESPCVPHGGRGFLDPSQRRQSGPGGYHGRRGSLAARTFAGPTRSDHRDASLSDRAVSEIALPEDQPACQPWIRRSRRVPDTLPGVRGKGGHRDHAHLQALPGWGPRVQTQARGPLPYLDFSTPERRLAACEAEVALNRRTAPALYLGARRITNDPGGTLAFDGAGDLVDAVVEMRRFPEADLFDVMARDGRLEPSHVAELAQVIATFHASAEIHQDEGGAAAMATLVDMNEAALRSMRLLTAEGTEALTARFRSHLARHAPLLDARRTAGKVRRCHGDMTLRNICLFEGKTDAVRLHRIQRDHRDDRCPVRPRLHPHGSLAP